MAASRPGGGGPSSALPTDPQVRVLGVASAGGHLEQLWHLAPRLRPSITMWCSYDVTHARTLLAAERHIVAHHPTTKNVVNAVRNYQVARRLFATTPIDVVISTGAAVAVPFMLAGTREGIECHYIESATRVRGPSLSGRILERLTNVRLYRQLGDWGAPRWRPGPSVFDGYAAVSGPARHVRSVLASLGTHRFPFTAFTSRMAAVAGDGGLGVTWQLGGTRSAAGLVGSVHEHLAVGALRELAAEVDVVVGHAWVGLVLTALAAGKVPVIVPRRRSRGEHTDDHQVQLAAELDRRGLAVVAEVGELSRGHLERAASLVVTYDEPPPFALVD